MPSLTPLSALLQMPLPFAWVVPFEVVPSKISTLAFDSVVPERVKLAPTKPFSCGLVIAGAAGTIVSTLQLRLAGEGSWMPEASMALTLKVWLPWLRGPG